MKIPIGLRDSFLRLVGKYRQRDVRITIIGSSKTDPEFSFIKPD
ncbi:MAG TPA: hypothetical protein VIK29_05675 [Paludibacter sp.]